jgi:hypothetical protein
MHFLSLENNEAAGNKSLPELESGANYYPYNSIADYYFLQPQNRYAFSLT